MSDNINNQYDFFQAVQLDDDGNLLVSIVGGGLNGDYLPLSGGTVTGDTIFTSGFTANSLSSNSIVWEDVDASGVVIAPKASSVSALNNTNSLGHGSNIALTYNTDSGVITSNNSTIRKSSHSLICSSQNSLILNTERSSVIASNDSTIGVDTGDSTGERNFIIGSENSLLRNYGAHAYYGIYNSGIIGSENVTLSGTNSAGETTERVVVIGMKDYITGEQGVHIENLYITSGATADYVWTAVDSSGRGEWRVSSGGGGNLNVDGGNASSIPVDVNIDGGGA